MKRISISAQAVTGAPDQGGSQFQARHPESAPAARGPDCCTGSAGNPSLRAKAYDDGGYQYAATASQDGLAFDHSAFSPLS